MLGLKPMEMVFIALVILFLNLKWPADCFGFAPWPGKS